MNITQVKSLSAFQLGCTMSSFPLTLGGTSTTCGKSAAIKGLSCLILLTGRMFGQGRPSMKRGARITGRRSMSSNLHVTERQLGEDMSCRVVVHFLGRADREWS